jgi:hypothetical protein
MLILALGLGTPVASHNDASISTTTLSVMLVCVGPSSLYTLFASELVAHGGP